MRLDEGRVLGIEIGDRLAGRGEGGELLVDGLGEFFEFGDQRLGFGVLEFGRGAGLDRLGVDLGGGPMAFAVLEPREALLGLFERGGGFVRGLLNRRDGVAGGRHGGFALLDLGLGGGGGLGGSGEGGGQGFDVLGKGGDLGVELRGFLGGGLVAGLDLGKGTDFAGTFGAGLLERRGGCFRLRPLRADPGFKAGDRVVAVLGAGLGEFVFEPLQLARGGLGLLVGGGDPLVDGGDGRALGGDFRGDGIELGAGLGGLFLFRRKLLVGGGEPLFDLVRAFRGGGVEFARLVQRGFGIGEALAGFVELLLRGVRRSPSAAATVSGCLRISSRRETRRWPIGGGFASKLPAGFPLATSHTVIWPR